MSESMGHGPLWGRCPAPSLNFNHNLLRQGTGTADHLTLLRLFPLLFTQLTSLWLKPQLIWLLQLANERMVIDAQDNLELLSWTLNQ